jgi:hypothetical protein
LHCFSYRCSPSWARFRSRPSAGRFSAAVSRTGARPFRSTWPETGSRSGLAMSAPQDPFFSLTFQAPGSVCRPRELRSLVPDFVFPRGFLQSPTVPCCARRFVCCLGSSRADPAPESGLPLRLRVFARDTGLCSAIVGRLDFSLLRFFAWNRCSAAAARFHCCPKCCAQDYIFRFDFAAVVLVF